MRNQCTRRSTTCTYYFPRSNSLDWIRTTIRAKQSCIIVTSACTGLLRILFRLLEIQKINSSHIQRVRGWGTRCERNYKEASKGAPIITRGYCRAEYEIIYDPTVTPRSEIGARRDPSPGSNSEVPPKLGTSPAPARWASAAFSRPGATGERSGREGT